MEALVLIRPASKALRLGPIVVLLIAAIGAPFYVQDAYVIRLLTGLCFFVSLAASWNIIGGYAGYLSLGHVTFSGTGAYVAALLATRFHLEPLLTIPIGALGAALVALIVGYPSLRLRGPYFAVVTLSIASLAQVLTQNITQVGGGLGIILPPLFKTDYSASSIFYWIFLSIAILAVVIGFAAERSRHGLSLLAIRSDEEVAGVFGVGVVRAKLLAFVASAAIAGTAGAVYGFYLTYIEPRIVFDIGMSISIVLMGVLGGRATWAGPILGAAGVYLLSQMFVQGEISQILFGVILITAVFVMPGGLVRLGGRVMTSVVSLARRRRLDRPGATPSE